MRINKLFAFRFVQSKRFAFDSQVAFVVCFDLHCKSRNDGWGDSCDLPQVIRAICLAMTNQRVLRISLTQLCLKFHA